MAKQIVIQDFYLEEIEQNFSGFCSNPGQDLMKKLDENDKPFTIWVSFHIDLLKSQKGR